MSPITMTHSQPTSLVPKFSNSLRQTDHNLVDFNLLGDLYVDYCVGNFGQIARNFSFSASPNWSEFAYYAAKQWSACAWRMTKHRATPSETRLMAEVAARIRIHQEELLGIYQNDEEFLQVMATPYSFLNQLAHTYRFPPQDPLELNRALEATEMGLLVLGL